MKAFELARPRTIEKALESLPSTRGATERKVVLLAGGQDLLGELKDHLAEPDLVVDLKQIPGLASIEVDARGISIGALATLSAVEEHAQVAATYRAIHEAAASVASPQIRNVGTLGGNLCQRPRCWYYRHEHAPCIKKGGSECFAYAGLNKYNAILGGGPSYIVHPSDLAPALVAFGADAVIRGRRGERAVPLEQFFTLPSEGAVVKENVLAQDEILVKVNVPVLAGAGWRSTYVKFRERGSYDFALSSVALAARFEGDVIKEARLVLGGVAPIPWRAPKAEAALAGRNVDAETCKIAGELALEGAEPLQYNAYKVPLTQGLITKALRTVAKG